MLHSAGGNISVDLQSTSEERLSLRKIQKQQNINNRNKKTDLDQVIVQSLKLRFGPARCLQLSLERSKSPDSFFQGHGQPQVEWRGGLVETTTADCSAHVSPVVCLTIIVSTFIQNNVPVSKTTPYEKAKFLRKKTAENGGKL